MRLREAADGGVCVGCLDDDRKIKSFYRRNDRTMRSKWVFFLRTRTPPLKLYIYERTLRTVTASKSLMTRALLLLLCVGLLQAVVVKWDVVEWAEFRWPW